MLILNHRITGCVTNRVGLVGLYSVMKFSVENDLKLFYLKS